MNSIYSKRHGFHFSVIQESAGFHSKPLLHQLIYQISIKRRSSEATLDLHKSLFHVPSQTFIFTASNYTLHILTLTLEMTSSFFAHKKE